MVSLFHPDVDSVEQKHRAVVQQEHHLVRVDGTAHRLDRRVENLIAIQIWTKRSPLSMEGDRRNNLLRRNNAIYRAPVLCPVDHAPHSLNTPQIDGIRKSFRHTKSSKSSKKDYRKHQLWGVFTLESFGQNGDHDYRV